jgi:cytochrome c-type protein NapC
MLFIAPVLVASIVLILIIVIRPSLTDEKGGKILAFIGLFIIPIIAMVIGTNFHLEQSKSTDFCLSCHVMKPYGESLYIDDRSYIPAAHFQNNRVPQESACFTCHTQYTMFGSAKAKLRGLKHVYINYLGKIPETIELYSSYENRECLYCHGGARSFEEQEIHASVMADIRTSAVSCIDCHNLVHSISEVPKLKMWKAGGEK